MDAAVIFLSISAHIDICKFARYAWPKPSCEKKRAKATHQSVKLRHSGGHGSCRDLTASPLKHPDT